jgi:hypothetical protein
MRASACDPQTVTIEGVPILAAGGPYHGQGSAPEGDYFSQEDLDNIARANTALADELRVPVKLGHSAEQRLLRDSGLTKDEQQED